MDNDHPQTSPQDPSVENPEWWAEAGREFRRLQDKHRSRPPSVWTMLNWIALEPENLPVVLANMGFTGRLSKHPRGELAWWPKTDWEVYAMGRPRGLPTIFIDIGSGMWRTEDGYQRGADLIALAAFIWGLPYGKAAFRVARICGLRELPNVR